MAILTGAAGLTRSPLPVSAAANPPLVLITLENTEFSQAVAETYANYLNCGGGFAAGSVTPGFICQGTLYKSSFSAQHPSLPNYLDVASGGDDGCLNDSCPRSGFAQTSLFREIGNSGSSFLSLEESMPSPCDSSDSGPYVAHHNPEVYFKDVAPVTGLLFNCGATDVGVADSFPNADAWPNPLPSFSLITPNLCHDAHGWVVSGVEQCAASTGPAENCSGFSGRPFLICNADNWLAVNVPALLSQTPQPAVVLTFDEGKTSLCGDGANACGGRVMTAMVGPGVRVGPDSSGPYSHFSLLRGIEGFLGVPCQQAACVAVPISIPQLSGDLGNPDPPGPVSVAAASPSTVALVWGAAVDSDGEPIAGYEVDRSGDGGSTWTPMGQLGTPQMATPLNGGVVTSGTNSFTDSSATAGAIYAYEVRTVDSHGKASGWATIQGMVVPSTGNCSLTNGVLTLQQCAAGHGMSANPSITLSKNIGTGDFLVAIIGSSGPSKTQFCVAVKVTPAPWKPVTGSPSVCSSPKFNATMYNVVNSAAQSCPCTVPFTLTAPEDWTMWVGDYSGVMASSPLDVSAASDSAFLPATTMSTGATQATTRPADLAVAAMWNDNSLPALGPSALPGTDSGSWSEVDVAAQGGGGWMEILQRVVANSGVTLGAQDTMTEGAKVRGMVAAFRTA